MGCNKKKGSPAYTAKLLKQYDDVLRATYGPHTAAKEITMSDNKLYVQITPEQSVCAHQISFTVNRKSKKVTDLKFYGGCPGMHEAFAKAVDGMTVARIMETFGSLGDCAGKHTSCVHEFLKALKAAMATPHPPVKDQTITFHDINNGKSYEVPLARCVKTTKNIANSRGKRTLHMLKTTVSGRKQSLFVSKYLYEAIQCKELAEDD